MGIGYVYSGPCICRLCQTSHKGCLMKLHQVESSNFHAHKWWVLQRLSLKWLSLLNPSLLAEARWEREGVPQSDWVPLYLSGTRCSLLLVSSSCHGCTVSAGSVWQWMWLPSTPLLTTPAQLSHTWWLLEKTTSLKLVSCFQWELEWGDIVVYIKGCALNCMIMFMCQVLLLGMTSSQSVTFFSVFQNWCCVHF